MIARLNFPPEDGWVVCRPYPNSAVDDITDGLPWYAIVEDDSERVYNNMPAFGLGDAGTLQPAERPLETVAKRLGTEDADLAVGADSSPVEDHSE